MATTYEQAAADLAARRADRARAELAAALGRVAAGDRDAFEDVYRRTSAKLLGVCLRILPERQEAEEALQEAYLTVWRRASAFDASCGSAMTWLMTLARNRAIDRLRARGRVQTAPIEAAEDVPDAAPDAEALAFAHADEARLTRCLETLAAGDARFVRTAFFEGSPYSELAARAGVPLGTVKSRIRRALLKLRACLS